MNTGDSAEFSEDNYTAEQNSNNQPQVEESPQNETEEVEYEYVDEDGNPVSEDELEGYAEEVSEEVEYVDEDGNPVSEDEIETKEIQEPERTFSQEETNIIQAEEPVQEIAEETIQEPEQTFSQEETNIIQAEEPVQETIQETVEPIIETQPLTEEKPVDQLDVDHFISNAQKAQEIIEQQPIQEPPRVVSTLNPIQQPEQPTIQETVEPVKTEKELDVDHFISNAQKAQESMKESVEPDQIQKPDDTEELLQRLTMGKSTASRAVQDNSEDTKENPYIYRQGHPHLDSHTDLDKIRKITEKLFFSSDEGANKMKEHKKKTKFSI